ncbi:MAG: RecQ family ATP-dependent DNA helicase, partial [Planctomycetota bacterium]
MSDSAKRARAAARALDFHFGFDSLFPLQAEIVDRILSGGNALVVMPTGYGKSLCYQLPALVRDPACALPEEGVTLVFSPLIALMEDQVAALRAKGIRAQFINSTLDRRERERRYESLAEGAYDLIYATPERMAKPEFVDALETTPGGVRLLAIDETHCITKWGHDFRPAYREVGRFRRELGSPPTVALTATATPSVREDIWETLDLDSERMPLFASGIDRPNLELHSIEVWDEADRVEAIGQIGEARPGTGIVYFALIKTIEAMTAAIRERHDGEVEVYHGRLDAREKKRVYDRFSAARPEDRLLLLATNAFGMGVDKADIRYIVHALVPGSVAAYYQEVGRAGRDGKSSTCVLLYDQADLAIQQ